MIKLILVAALQCACVSSSIKNLESKEDLAQLETDLADAQRRQVDILSSYNFDHAREMINRARTEKNLAEDLRQARKFLTSALAAAEIAYHNIDDVIEVRRKALDLKVDQKFPEAFALADLHMRRVCRYLEGQELDPMVDLRVRLKQDYQKLIHAIEK